MGTLESRHASFELDGSQSDAVKGHISLLGMFLNQFPVQIPSFAIMEHGPFLTGGEKQPLVPRPSEKKCRRRHTAAIGNVNLAPGPLDKRKASECNFRSVATEDRLGSLERKMQRRFDLDGIRRTAMTTLVQWCRNLVQCGGEHLHFVNSFLAGF